MVDLSERFPGVKQEFSWKSFENVNLILKKDKDGKYIKNEKGKAKQFEVSNGTFTFELTFNGFSTEFVNTIRVALGCDVPTFAIKSAVFKEYPSLNPIGPDMFLEILSQVPLEFDPILLEKIKLNDGQCKTATDEICSGCTKCAIFFTLLADAKTCSLHQTPHFSHKMLVINSNSINIDPIYSQFIKVKFPDILLLKINYHEKIEMNGWIKRATGRKHPRFNPVEGGGIMLDHHHITKREYISHKSYQFQTDVLSKIQTDNLSESTKDIKRKFESTIENQQQFKSQVLNEPDKKVHPKVENPKEEIAEQSKEIESKEDPLDELIPVYGAKMTLEMITIGHLPPKDLLTVCFKQLIGKFNYWIENLKKMTIKLKYHNSADFRFIGEDHLLGVILEKYSSYIKECYFLGYKKRHPSDSFIDVSVKTLPDCNTVSCRDIIVNCLILANQDLSFCLDKL
jgi:DNA-directed RNA polymerase subunit L